MCSPGCNLPGAVVVGVLIPPYDLDGELNRSPLRNSADFYVWHRSGNLGRTQRRLGLGCLRPDRGAIAKKTRRPTHLRSQMESFRRNIAYVPLRCCGGGNFLT